jgi:hypothetical protein
MIHAADKRDFRNRNIIMKRFFSNSSFVLLMFMFVACGSKEDGNSKTNLSQKQPQCPSEIFDTAPEAETYGFDGDFQAEFIDHPAWGSHNAKLAQIDGKIQISATGTHISEAWKTWHKPMPHNRSWKIAVDVSIPLAWDRSNTPDAQVGGGPWVSKLTADGKGRRVYEVNHASIARKFRFVQGQLIKNRLGDDPINVEHKKVDQETLRLTIIYCAVDHTINLYANNEHIDTQPIDSRGIDNWDMTDNDHFYVGIMGFAEQTDLSKDFVTMDNFEVRQ